MRRCRVPDDRSLPAGSPSRRGTRWLLVTLVLLVAAAAVGGAELVVGVPVALAWAGVVLVVLGMTAAVVTTVVVSRDTGTSVPRTLGRALLAPFRFLLELP